MKVERSGQRDSKKFRSCKAKMSCLVFIYIFLVFSRKREWSVACIAIYQGGQIRDNLKRAHQMWQLVDH